LCNLQQLKKNGQHISTDACIEGDKEPEQCISSALNEDLGIQAQTNLDSIATCSHAKVTYSISLLHSL
jgi:hypothetical protein